ncbi:MAG TPA: Mrp/NBP35 family ATP-binding protein [Actinomycetota bacterium]|nr:Mrp/NBP35 family ATP-binding protein [Actinomycetota bacterium]
MDELRRAMGGPLGPQPARFVVPVASGKGGVGKSTVSLNLALALSQAGSSVGLLDADFYGPDIPRMVNLARKVHLKSWTMYSRSRRKIDPLDVHGLKLMSMGFLVGEDQSVDVSGWVDFLLGQMFRDVAWGELDYLIVDLPPGTADLQVRLAKEVQLAGAILVVTPQDVAHLDAKKVLTMYRDAGVRVLGAVENMSGLRCPGCSESIDVFPRVREDRSIWALGVDKLMDIPLDPQVAQAGDDGRPLLVAHPDSPQSQAFRDLARRVSRVLEPTGA